MQSKIVASLVLVVLALGAFSVQAQPVDIFEAPTSQQGYQLYAEQSAAPAQGAGEQQATPAALGRAQPGLLGGRQSTPGLLGRTEGTIYMLSADNAGQISVYINGQPSGPFTLQLKSDGTSQGILELLLYALENEQAINIGYGYSQEIVDVEIRK